MRIKIQRHTKLQKMDYTIDAKNKPLGRLASEIAVVLQGKKSPYYEPRLAGGVKVIVKNADKIIFSKNKLIQKKYFKHTGYVGHLKEYSLEELWQKSPEKVIRQAVKRMLPKNYLREKRMKRLIIEK